MIQEVEMLKHGVQVIKVDLKRSRKGLHIAAHTHPAVEELLRGWSTGEKHPVAKWGRQWEVEGETTKLEAWDLATNPGVLPLDGSIKGFCLDRVGNTIIETRTWGKENGGASSGDVLNMSFLRCVGISEGGVDFFLKGVYSPQLITDIAGAIKQANRTIYINFMRPIDFRISLTVDERGPITSTQPWAGNRNGLT